METKCFVHLKVDLNSRCVVFQSCEDWIIGRCNLFYVCNYWEREFGNKNFLEDFFVPLFA